MSRRSESDTTVGLNLQKADGIVSLEPLGSSAAFQLVGRIVRMGSRQHKADVKIYHVV